MLQIDCLLAFPVLLTLIIHDFKTNIDGVPLLDGAQVAGAQPRRLQLSPVHEALHLVKLGSGHLQKPEPLRLVEALDEPC